MKMLIFFLIAGTQLCSCYCSRENTRNNRALQDYTSLKVNAETTGFYLQEKNGCVLASRNSNYAYYPASSIKVLQMLHALLAVQQGQVSLDTLVSKFPAEAESCADVHTGHTAQLITLRELLRQMMRSSDNQSTNAIQEFFGNGNAASGRQKINNTAHEVLGMSNATQLHHKFDCGGANLNPANTATLADMQKLYEKLSNGILSNQYLSIVDDIMRDINRVKLDSIIDIEAGSLGITDASVIAAYKRGIKSRIKIGNWPGKRYQSVSGWASLPTVQGRPKEYFIGFFVNHATNDSLLSASDTFMGEAAVMVLRPVIRSTLATYR